MKVRLYARAEVVRLLRVDGELLDTLERERIVVRRRGGYDPGDLERLRIAVELARLDVNPPGVAVALRMREQLIAERRRLRAIIEALRSRLLERETN